MKQGLFILSLAVLVGCSHRSTSEYLDSNLDYFFHELHVKGYERMRELISPWTQKALELKKQPRQVETEIGHSPEVVQAVRKALVIVLSKPSYGNKVVSNLVQDIQEDYLDDFFTIIFSITKQASAGLKNEDRSLLERATYFYILENIVIELAPYTAAEEMAKNILTYISQEKIKIPESVHSERYMRILESKTISPSKQAEKVLNKKQKS